MSRLLMFRRGSCLLLVLAALAVSCSAAAFLGDKLPLTVTVTTPYELLESSEVSLSGTQTLTVVFSRPVQALGSGFQTSSSPDQIPFSLSCGVPGRFRWVTTSIARFDPSIPWPADLRCTLRWNTQLTTYDGAKLVTTGLEDVTLTTEPLVVSLLSVTSATAAKLTDGLWDATVGSPPDKLPEVPPDGTIQLQFSGTVSAELVGTVLKVHKDDQDKPGAVAPVGVKVRQCPEVQAPIPLVDTAVAGRALSVQPDCLEVNLTAALQPNTYYHLCLPAGARYSRYAGLPAKPVCVRIAGLRPFRIPFQKSDKDSRVQFRRLDLWLPHGLQSSSSLPGLASALSLCQVKGASCTPVKIAVSRPVKGILRVAADLQPGKTYRLRVKASPGVKDGYGQPLQAGSVEFVMSAVDPVLQHIVTGTDIVTFEAAAGSSAVTWPYVAYGTPRDVRNASLWGSAGQPARLRQVFTNGGGVAGTAGLVQKIGKPDATITTMPMSKWYSLQFNTSSIPGPWLAASCCQPVFNTGNTAGGSSPLLVGAALLQEATVMASAVLSGARLIVLVTSSTGPAASLPLDVYQTQDRDPAKLLGSATTDAQGVATLTLPQPSPDTYFGVLAVLKPKGASPVVLPGLSVDVVPPQDPYRGSVVLDRRLVRAGETLHVAGAIRREDTPGTLALPEGVSFALQLSPNPQASNDTLPLYPLTIDPTFGTFTVDLPLPNFAQYTTYTVAIVHGASPSSSAPSTPAGDTAAGSTAASVAPRAKPVGPVATPASPGDDAWQTVQGSFEDFVVADPRPPTVALELTTPNWVTLAGKLTVGIQTVSYLGSAVSAAPVGIAWSYGSANGVLNATTNSEGAANATLDLATVPAASRPDPATPSSVYLTAEWVGPTRERVTRQASVLVAVSRYTISVRRSSETHVPGEAFFVTATVQDNESGTEALNGNVTVSIVSPAKGRKPSCPLPKPCVVAAGSQKYSSCSLALPCVGDFELKACFLDSCTSSSIGNNATTWKRMPLNSFSNLVVTLDATNYTVGQSARIYYHLPRPASAVLVVVASATNTTTQVYKSVPAGLAEAEIKIDQSLTAGAFVQVVAHLPRSKLPALPVPVSVLFDPNAPTSLQASVSLTVTQSWNLEVAVEAPAVLEPGATAQVSVNVKGAGGPARVVVLAVDQAVLDLVPYSLPSLYVGSAGLDQVPRLSTTSLGSTIVSRRAVQAVFQAALRILRKDPWLSPYDLMALRTSAFRIPADTPEAEFLAQFAFQLTAFPSPGGPVRTAGIMTVALPMAASGNPSSVPAPRAKRPDDAPESAASTASTDSSNPRSQSQFVTTPLFAVVTVDAAGVGVVNFTAPANLGKFAVRAFAITGETSKAGSAEAGVVVRREVSLTASTPRFVRTGDTFEAGVIVTAATTEAAVTVTVGVKLAAGARAAVVGGATKKVTLDKGQKQQEVRFRFKAAASPGNITATFTASGGASSKDALQVAVPVETQLQPVVLGTSFAINASSATPWQEGLELPAAAPGTGSVELTASVGYLATVQATQRQLVTDTPQQADGYWAAAVALHSGALGLYKQAVGAPGPLRQAVAWLKSLTSPALGLAPYPSTLNYYPDRPDISLNTWAAWLASLYPAASLDPVITKSAPTWAAAAAKQLTEDAEKYRAFTKEGWPDLELVAWVRAVQGSKWEPATKDAAVQKDLAWARLTSNVSSLSLTARSLVALTLLHEKVPPTDKTVADITKRLQSALRTQGRTAYVAEGNDATAAGLEDQALALLTLTKARSPSPLVPKLAAYLAAGKPPAPVLWATLPASYPSRLAALTQAALASYDAWVGNTAPSLSISATTAPPTPSPLLSATFSTASAPPVTRTTPWSALPANATAIDFAANGMGQATVAATLRFVPARPLQAPTYRGIWVEKAYQAVAAGTGDAVGPPLATVKLGSLVAVTVQLTTPDDLPDVELQVPLPGGLEPQDPSIFTDAAAQLTCAEGDQGPSLARRFPWWWWPVCPAQETRPQTVTFRYAQLTAGIHSVRFLAVAASVGGFVDPPAKAFVRKQPELMGLTASGRFAVCDGVGCKAVAAPAAKPLKECNAGCNGNGACDLTSGKCICDQGFTGADCGKPGP